jgi:hypothetical protein
MKEESVPGTILNIILTEQTRIDTQLHEKRMREQEEHQADVNRGKAKFGTWLEKALGKMPEIIAPYYTGIMTDESEENVFSWLGRTENMPDYDLRFDVPGLAPVVFNHSRNVWGHATIDDSHYEIEPKWAMYFNALRRSETLEMTLLSARHEAVKMQAAMRKYQSDLEREEKFRKAEELSDAISYAKHEAQVAQEKSEAETLLAMLDQDPTAIIMLRAYVAIRKQHGIYEQLISDAEEAMFSQERRYESKAAKFRKQAQDAARQTSEEASRASDLEDDLAKIKKQSKRGW